MRSLVGQDFEKSTLQKYETCLMHLRDFLLWKYKAKDLAVKQITFELLNDFDYYLRSIRKCGNNSAIKYFKNFGKIIRLCIGNGWLIVNSYINYKPKTTRVNRIALSNEELARITNKQFAVSRLNGVKDMFLFCCYTGLAYVDVRKLKRSELIIGVDGELWIMTSRQEVWSNHIV